MAGPCALFTPARLGGLDLANRLIAAPMCQYSARDGLLRPWHGQHLGSLAISGVSLLILEATAVSPEGRITLFDAGLWSDEQEEVAARVLQDLRTFSDVRLGVQLSHAGRKASVQPPWIDKGRPLTAAEGAWEIRAPSPLSFDHGWPTPAALTREDLTGVVEAFRQSALRALRCGFDLVEIHAAHGYLLSAFLSPLSNHRQDGYGGSPEARMRLVLEVVEAVRSVWPVDRAMGVRVNGSDWTEGGVTIAETIGLAQALKALRVDYLHLSSGGNVPRAIIPGDQPGYQAPFAAAVKQAVPDLATVAVGMITTPEQAEDLLQEGAADFIALARALLDDPRWPLRAARALGAPAPYPPQYERAAEGVWPGYARAHPRRATS